MFPQQGRIAGVDYGHVRIGLAISDAGQTISSPFENYQRQAEESDGKYFRKFAIDEQVVGFVVGLPVHASGDESEKSLEARRFGAWLADITKLPVTFCDERYSTAAAEQFLSIAGLTSKKRKRRRDMLAAQVILASYLESSRSDTDAPGSLE
jgi:putative Holliday junction resolvase